MKGSKNVALTRAEAKSVINDALAISLQDWLKDTWVPDEHFYSTLATVKSYDMEVNHSLVTLFRSDLESFFQKGTVKQDLSCNCRTLNCCTKFACIRKSLWFDRESEQTVLCKGKVIRWICNLSTADLPRIREDAAALNCFMANKFNLDVDPVAVLCQAKDIVKKTMGMWT